MRIGEAHILLYIFHQFCNHIDTLLLHNWFTLLVNGSTIEGYRQPSQTREVVLYLVIKPICFDVVTTFMPTLSDFRLCGCQPAFSLSHLAKPIQRGKVIPNCLWL
jgi:hypothetical protein